MVHEIKITILLSTETKGDAMEHLTDILEEIKSDIDIDRDSNYQSQGVIEEDGYEKQWEYEIREL